MSFHQFFNTFFFKFIEEIAVLELLLLFPFEISHNFIFKIEANMMEEENGKGISQKNLFDGN